MDAKTLRSKAQAGVAPIEKITSHENEMLVFDVREGRWEHKSFDDTAFGPWEGIACPVLIANPDGSFAMVGESKEEKVPLFQKVLNKTADVAIGNKVEWVIGRLVTSGRAYILTEPADNEWGFIAKAVTAYENSF